MYYIYDYYFIKNIEYLSFLCNNVFIQDSLSIHSAKFSAEYLRHLPNLTFFLF